MIIFVLLLIIIIVIALMIYENNRMEGFTENKLYIKKTSDYEKVFSNSKYSVWCPKPINDYYPVGHYISLNKNPPKTMATLVKNNSGIESNDKPIKYEIIGISNDNYAIWKPIAAENYTAMGHIFSKEYPSKYLIRTVPSRFVNKSTINKRLVSNKISNFDRGYELWDINNSNLFVCNNLNNKNLNYIKDVYSFNHSLLSIEKLLFIKTINSYKKIVSYKDTKLNKDFTVWRPIPTQNFCSLGDIVLKGKKDPNGKLDTIVVHKSFCKIPIDYGNKSVCKIRNKSNDESKNINFWRPKPHKNHFFFGDIVVVGENQPEADNLIYSISLDYIKKLNNNTSSLVYNNINEDNSISIWSDENNFLTVNNSYDVPKNDKLVINKMFSKSSLDLSDVRKMVNIKYTRNNNINKISDQKLIENIQKNLSDKLDVKINRLNDITLDKEFVNLNILQRENGSNDERISKIISKLSKMIDNEPVKIYDEQKTVYFIRLHKVYSKQKDNMLELDNTEFKDVVEI